MDITKGSVVIVKKFLEEGSQRVGMHEMTEFWKVCTDEEKLAFTKEAVALMPELAQ